MSARLHCVCVLSVAQRIRENSELTVSVCDGARRRLLYLKKKKKSGEPNGRWTSLTWAIFLNFSTHMSKTLCYCDITINILFLNLVFFQSFLIF